jgi:hypothetical protein
VIFQLPSGKCIEISYDYYDKMTDEMVMELMASNIGFTTEDPFKINTRKGVKSDDDDAPDPSRFVSLDQYTKEEKMNDSDYINTDDI